MELTANALQTVLANSNVLFTNTAVSGKNCSIVHRNGSGLVTLRGITNQCRARFRVSFGANVALPADAAVDTVIQLALSVDGEPTGSATMISTPGAVEEFNNVFASIFIDVPSGCCQTISVKNISEEEIDVQNANLIVERVA